MPSATAGRRAAAWQTTARSSRRGRTAAASDRNTRSPGIATSWPNGYVTRSTSWPRSVSARMRWNSLNGVPRGSKNGSGAIIRMRMQLRDFLTDSSYNRATPPTWPTSPDVRLLRRRIVLAVEIVVSVGLLTFLFSRVDVAALWAGARRASVRVARDRPRAVLLQRGDERVALAAAAARAGRAGAGSHAAVARTWSPGSSTISCRARSAATSCASATPRGPRSRRRSPRRSCSSIGRSG